MSGTGEAIPVVYVVNQPAVLNLSSYLKGPFNKWQGLAVSAW